MRLIVATTSAVALVLVGCGSDQPSTDEVVETLPDADELISDAEELGISPLALALDQTASATAYRAHLSMGMDLAFDGEGPSITLEADPSTPMMTFEADAEGQNHSRVDLGVMFDGMAASMGLDGDDLAAMFGDDLSMETWVDGSTVVVDLGGLGSMLALTGTAFPDDRFSIDLDRLGPAIGVNDITSAFSGQAAPDPVEMAEVLAEVLDADGEGPTYAGTIGFLDYARAFGQDPQAMLGESAAPLVDLIGPEAGDAMLDLFGSITADVEVTLAEGAVDLVRFDVDFAPMFENLPDLIGSIDDGAPAPDPAEAAQLANSTFTMTMVIDYDLDPNVDVVVPTDDVPDATDDFLAQFGASFDA